MRRFKRMVLPQNFNWKIRKITAFKTFLKMKHLLLRSKCSIFHNVFMLKKIAIFVEILRVNSLADPTLIWDHYTGLQLRKSEQNVFYYNFLISQSNPTIWPSLKLSLRDDSNEWSNHRVWLRNKKVSILKTLNFRPYLLPWLYLHKDVSHMLTPSSVGVGKVH